MKKKTMISDYIKDLLKKADKDANSPYKNVREFAKYIGISHTVVHDIINGKYNTPSPLTAARMCKWLSLEPNTLLDMINIDGDKDQFIEDFYNKYDGVDFSEKCKKTLVSFVGYYDKINNKNIKILYDNNEKIASLSDIELVNTDKDSIYDSKAYNATCLYSFYTVGYEENDINKEQIFVKHYDYECMLYYLPARRIRKHSSNVYADEEIRDFVNKFMYLVSQEHIHPHNIFITSSKQLFDKIVKYTGNMEMIPKLSNLGVILIYQPIGYSYNYEYKMLIDNGDEFMKALTI